MVPFEMKHFSWDTWQRYWLRVFYLLELTIHPRTIKPMEFYQSWSSWHTHAGHTSVDTLIHITSTSTAEIKWRKGLIWSCTLTLSKIFYPKFTLAKFIYPPKSLASSKLFHEISYAAIVLRVTWFIHEVLCNGWVTLPKRTAVADRARSVV